MVELSDAALLEAIRRGETPALEALLERYQALVYRFGMRMCRDPEDAADVLQDTLFAAARSAREFRGASSVSTWLYTIARSFCIKRHRRSKFAPDREESLDAARDVACASDPEKSAAQGEIDTALQHAIAALEPMYREVLVLRDGEGLTAAEVADIVGISVDAVKSRLHRARAVVREALAPTLGIGESSVDPRCPDVVELFSRHVEGDISATICAEMERHLESCAQCRVRCDSLREVLGRCRTSTPVVPEKVKREVRRALHASLAKLA